MTNSNGTSTSSDKIPGVDEEHLFEDLIQLASEEFMSAEETSEAKKGKKGGNNKKIDPRHEEMMKEDIK